MFLVFIILGFFFLGVGGEKSSRKNTKWCDQMVIILWGSSTWIGLYLLDSMYDIAGGPQLIFFYHLVAVLMIHL